MCSLVFKPLVPCEQILVLESTFDPVAEISMTSSLSLLVKIAQRAEFSLAHAIVTFFMQRCSTPLLKIEISRPLRGLVKSLCSDAGG